MLGRLKLRRLVLAALVLSGLLLSESAFAVPIRLQLVNGTTVINILDGALLDSNAAIGTVTYSGSVGKWDVNVTTALGSGSLSPIGHMDLASINVNSWGSGDPGTLTIRFTELNIDVAYPSFDLRLGGTNTRTSLQYEAYYDNTNLYPTTATGSATAGATPVLIGSLGPYSGSGSFSGSMSGSASTDTSYALTQTLEINALSPFPGNVFSADAELIPHPVPEPSTLLLLGSGLLVLAARRRR